MKTLIVSGGKEPSKELLLNEVKDSKLIIGADKGCEVLHRYDIIPNYILGDFDSANIDIINLMESLGCKKLKFKKEKDFTDTEIAVDLAIENGASKIILLGATGTRYDHSLSNIGLMLKGLKNSIDIEIIDDNNKMFLTNKNMILEGNSGDIISFHAYSNLVKNFTIKGAKYELKNYDLNLGDGITTSNEFVKNNIVISFDSGIVLVLYTKD